MFPCKLACHVNQFMTAFVPLAAGEKVAAGLAGPFRI